jgi:hypothetical protein
MVEKRIEITILIVSLFIILGSCNPTTSSYENSETFDTSSILKNKYDTPITDTYRKAKIISPEVFLFKYSKCIENCKDDERIISIHQRSDSLILKIGSIQNCVGKFRLEIKVQNDTLSMDIRIKEEIRKRKDGTLDTIITSQECDCYYYFDIGIKNLTSGHKTVLLDGHIIGNKKSKTLLHSR